MFLLTQFWALTGQLHGSLSTALAGVRCLAASYSGTDMFLRKFWCSKDSKTYRQSFAHLPSFTNILAAIMLKCFSN